MHPANEKAHDAGLVHVQKLKNLNRLGLKWTSITDMGLLHLKTLPKLKSLQLEGTRVTGAGISELRKTFPECKISHEDPSRV